jgi:hypothetical protein
LAILQAGAPRYMIWFGWKLAPQKQSMFHWKKYLKSGTLIPHTFVYG